MKMIQIRGHRGIGMVIREAAVHVEEQLRYLDVQAFERAVKEGACGSVAGVGDDFNTPREFELGATASR